MIGIEEGMAGVVDYVEAARAETVEKLATPRLRATQRMNPYIGAAAKQLPDALALLLCACQVFGGIDYEQHIKTGGLHPLVAPLRH